MEMLKFFAPVSANMLKTVTNGTSDSLIMVVLLHLPVVTRKMEVKIGKERKYFI